MSSPSSWPIWPPSPAGRSSILPAARGPARRGPVRGATRLAGQDTNAATCRIAAARLIADGGVVEVAVGDSLRADGFPGRLFGAVVCEPPFGERAWGHDELGHRPVRWRHGLLPGGSRSWHGFQHCLSHAEPGAHVVVIMPTAAADRRAGRLYRRNLVRSGALRAVVGFTGETAARSADAVGVAAPAPTGVAAHLTCCSPSRSPRTSRGTGSVSSTAVLAEGPGYAPSPRWTCSTRRSTSPRRTTSCRRPPTTTSGHLRRALEHAVRSLPTVPRFVGRTSERPTTTVGGPHPGIRRRGAPGAGPYHRRRRRRSRAHRPRPRRLPGPTGRTASDPALVELRPGDVVVPTLTGRDVAVRVVGDAEAGAVLGPRLLCLRPDPARLDPRVVGRLPAGLGSSAVGAATSLSRSDFAGSACRCCRSTSSAGWVPPSPGSPRSTGRAPLRRRR